MIDYDPHKWRTFFNVRGTMLVTLSWRAGIILVWGIAVVAANEYWRPLAISELAHGLIGTALGLLLVFRTNASYDRFWEGRKLWGSIVNASRNLSRLGHVQLAKAPSLRDALLADVVAFAPSAMRELRGDKNGAAHGPTLVAVSLTKTLQRAVEQKLITDVQQAELDRQVVVLVDSIGACERIHKTPLPFAYVVHLRRALVLYCLSLPFALLDRFHVGAALVAFLIAMVLFGIEEIGVEIEDPFGTDDNDLPLEDICAGIERQTRALMVDNP